MHLKEEKQIKNLKDNETYPGVPEIQMHTINHTQQIRRFLKILQSSQWPIGYKYFQSA